jgi:hypothetical protein
VDMGWLGFAQGKGKEGEYALDARRRRRADEDLAKGLRRSPSYPPLLRPLRVCQVGNFIKKIKFFL